MGETLEGIQQILPGLSVIIVLGIGCSHGIHRISPRENMWVTWANSTNQSSFCLSMSRPEDPLRTCLIGVPYLLLADCKGWVSNDTILNESQINATCYEQFKCTLPPLPQCCKGGKNLTGIAASIIINHLNKTMPWDPQELGMLGSTPGNASFYFGGPALTGTNYYRSFSWSQWTNVTSKESIYDYKDQDGYCQGAVGAETLQSKVPIWNNKQLSNYRKVIF